jgi:hypothetical protein
MSTSFNAISSKIVEITVQALGVLAAGRFVNLFWTLLLGGCFSLAFAVLAISLMLHPVTSRYTPPLATYRTLQPAELNLL